MDEYISRQNILNFIEENNNKNDWMINQYNADWIYSFIESQPVVDVKPVRYGQWIMSVSSHALECSECDMRVYAVLNYCPYCGAKMDIK